MLPSVTCLGEMNSKVQGNVIMYPLELVSLDKQIKNQESFCEDVGT